MSAKTISHEDYVLHSAKLYTTPAGMIGRTVKVTIGTSVVSCTVVSCVIEEKSMTLEITLVRFRGNKVSGLVFDATNCAWKLRVEKQPLINVDSIEFYHAP